MIYLIVIMKNQQTNNPKYNLESLLNNFLKIDIYPNMDDFFNKDISNENFPRNDSSIISDIVPKRDIHKKHKYKSKDNFNPNKNPIQQPSKNYSNSIYNKSYYINKPTNKNKKFKKFYDGNNESSSSNKKISTAYRSSDTESHQGYDKKRYSESNTENEYDTLEDFLETLGVDLCTYLCSQNGSRYFFLI